MRTSGWPAKLAEIFAEWQDCKFEWGRADCCQFVGAVGLAITGEDKRALFAGYDSEAGAAALLAQHGGMDGLLTHAFGEPKPAAHARRGDVVLVEFGSGPQPAIVDGAWCCAPALGGGLARRRIFGQRGMPDAVSSWSIG